MAAEGACNDGAQTFGEFGVFMDVDDLCCGWRFGIGTPLLTGLEGWKSSYEGGTDLNTLPIIVETP